jgi:hypothetical protein
MLIGQDDDVTGAHVDCGGSTVLISNVFALSGENIHAKPAHFEHSKFRLELSTLVRAAPPAQVRTSRSMKPSRRAGDRTRAGTSER